jgi:hypothetical protein
MLKRNFFRDSYRYEGCKMVAIPSLPGSPTLRKQRISVHNNKGHIFGQRSVAKRCAKSHAKNKCESRAL